MQLVEALYQKTEGPGFDSQCGALKFSSDRILLAAFSSPGVHLASNRNGYQGVSLGANCDPCLQLTTLLS